MGTVVLYIFWNISSAQREFEILLTNASKLTIGLYAVSDGQGIMDELIINICRATFHDKPAKIKRCSVGLAIAYTLSFITLHISRF